MFSLVRSSAPCRLALSRAYATASTVTPPKDARPTTKAITASEAGVETEGDRIPVSDQHGLWGFFRRKEGLAEDETGEDAYYSVEPNPKALGLEFSGRAWNSNELRLKSFGDLHKLWYVLLRERNLLATQSATLTRLGLPKDAHGDMAERAQMCRASMGRIKGVLQQRSLAYQGATKLYEQRQMEALDAAILKQKTAELTQDRKVLESRRKVLQQHFERVGQEAESQNSTQAQPETEAVQVQ